MSFSNRKCPVCGNTNCLSRKDSDGRSFMVVHNHPKTGKECLGSYKDVTPNLRPLKVCPDCEVESPVEETGHFARHHIFEGWKVCPGSGKLYEE